MNVLDADATLLRRLAEAAVHASTQAIVHNDAEVVGDIPGLLETLAPSGPYAYMLMPDLRPDGGIRLPVQTTRDEIRGIYEIVRGRSDVLSEEPVIELRTPWYAFWESVSTGRVKESGEVHENPLAILSPTGPADGITGEIIWPKLASRRFGSGAAPAEPVDEYRSRRDLRNQHLRYLEMLQAADVEGLLADFDERGASAVRDYVDETGALVELVSTTGHRAYWERFYEKFEVVSIDLLHRVAQDWYLFSEVRIAVRFRSDESRPGDWAFHTAEIWAPAKDGRVLAVLGFGTDLAPV